MRLKNDSVSFQCIAHIVPNQAINYLWKRNGSFIDTSINGRVILTKDDRFTIKRIRLEDFDSYQCVAQFGNTAVISQSVKLERACKSFKFKSKQQSWTKYVNRSDVFADYLSSSHLHIHTPFYPKTMLVWILKLKNVQATLYQGKMGKRGWFIKIVKFYVIPKDFVWDCRSL